MLQYFSLSNILLMAGFGFSLFIGGHNDPIFGPAIILIIFFSISSLLPGLQNGWQWPKSAAGFWLFLFWLYIALSLSWTSIPFDSYLHFGMVSALFLIFFSLVCSPHAEKLSTAAFGAIQICIGILAVWGIVQHCIVEPGSITHIVAHHPMRNPNSLAIFFVLGLFPAINWFLTFDCNRRKWGAYVFCFILFTALICTHSRGALLGLFCGLALFLFINRRHPRVNFKNLAWLFFGAIAAVLCVHFIEAYTTQLGDKYLFLSGFLFGSENEKLASNATASGLQRIYIWTGALEVLKRDPWLGIGLSTFYQHYASIRSVSDTSSAFWVHMDPLQFWIEMGILAPIIFYGALIAILMRTIKATKAMVAVPASDQLSAQLYLYMVFCALLAALLHTHITFHLYQMPIMIVLGVYLARWYLQTSKVLKADMPLVLIAPSPKKHAVLACGVILLAGYAYWIGIATVGVNYSNLARQQLANNDIEGFAEYTNKAHQIAPDSYYKPLLYAAEFQKALIANQVVAAPDKRRAAFEKSLELLNEAQKRNPLEPAIGNSRATLYYEMGDSNQAEKLWLKTLSHHPMHEISSMGLSDLYKRQGRTQEAVKVLEDALQWDFRRIASRTELKRKLKNLEQ